MKFEISTDLLGSYDGISGAKDHESFEWRVIQEGSPGAHVVFSISPPPPRYSSTVSGAARRRWWPINTDRSLTCTYVSVARVESREEQHRFFSFIFPPFFPPFFLSPLHPSSFFFFFLERSGRWSLPRADLDVSAIRFRSKRDRPTGNLRGWPMIGR